MKNMFYKLRPALLLVSLLAFTCLACNKVDIKETPAEASFYEIATDDVVNFSFLKSAIYRAGLVEKFSGIGNYNLFAPNNDAFISAGYKDTSMIRSADPAVLANILNYHLSAAPLNVDELPQGYSDLKAENQENLILFRDDKGNLSVNGAELLSKNHHATNGTFHLINRLLMPPSGNILETIAINPNLTYCAAAIDNAIAGNTDIGQLLSQPALTFFAPSDAAFKAGGYPNIDAVKNADPEVIAALLRYHIVAQRMFTADFSNIAIEAADGKQLFIAKPEAGVGLVNGLLLTGNNANVLASNGIIHITGKVLVPPTKHILDYVIGSNLTLLEAAILRTADGDTDIAALLSGAEEYTLFAPNNAAMNAAGYPTAAFIRTADPNAIAEMLRFHIVQKRQFSLSFVKDVTILHPLSGGNITVSSVSGFKVGGPGNSTLANVSPLDILATNGVVQTINQVLKP